VDRDRLRLDVDDEDRVRDALHVLDPAEVRLELLQVGLSGDALARRQQVELALGGVALEVVQPGDALADGLEVREQAAQPPVGDVRLARLLRRLGDGVAGLLLGPDEEDRPAAASDPGGELLRALEQRLGLKQVDDVDAVALAMDEPPHPRVPAARLVAEVNSSLQQLLDADLSHCPSLVAACGRTPPGRTANPAAGRRAGPRSRFRTVRKQSRRGSLALLGLRAPPAQARRRASVRLPGRARPRDRREAETSPRPARP
jgi:hypothetical protein